MDMTTLFPMITGALGGAASTGLFKGPIDTLQNIWYNTVGYKSAHKRELLEAIGEKNVELFMQDVANNFTKIDPQNIQNPKLSIAGPALEESIYYLEEDELRKMFSKLVTSSMDKTKNSLVHPAFLDVLKSISTAEAKLLKYMSLGFFNIKQLRFREITIIKPYKVETVPSGYPEDRTYFDTNGGQNFWLDYTDTTYDNIETSMPKLLPSEIEIPISVLLSKGIIEERFKETSEKRDTGLHSMTKSLDTALFLFIKESLTNQEKIYEFINLNNLYNSGARFEYESIHFKLTDFGESFVDCVVR